MTTFGKLQLSSVTRGGLWMAAGSAAENGLRLVRNLVLTRLLLPDAFGEMALIASITVGLQAFTDVGIGKTIIRSSHGNRTEFLNAAWWLALSRGIVLFTIGFLVAPSVASFYENAQLGELLRWSLLVILFASVRSPREGLALRELRYRPWVALQAGTAFAGVTSTLILSTIWPDTRALVGGMVAEGLSATILSYCIFPYRPGIRMNKAYTTEILRFGSRMAGLPVLTFLFSRADIFLIGKLMSAEALGVYYIAINLAHAPFMLLTQATARISLPLFSRVHKADNASKELLFEFTEKLILLGLPLLLFLGLNGKAILAIVYGSDYGAAAVPFGIALVTWFTVLIGTPIANYYFARGRPELHRFFTLVRALTVLVLIYPLTLFFGTVGAAASMLAGVALGHVLQLRTLRRLTGISLGEYTLTALKSARPTALLIAQWSITSVFVPADSWLFLLLGGATLAATYGLSLWLASSVSSKREPTTVSPSF